MENHRLLLYFTLFFILYLLWAEWQMDYGPKPVEVASSVESTAGVAEMPTAVPEAIGSADAPVVQQPTTSTSQGIRVVTDLLDIEIDTRGGDVRKVVLRKYATQAKKPDEKFVLLTDDLEGYHVAQSGLVSVQQDAAPTHNTVYRAEQQLYRLAEGETELKVPLHWNNADGVKVTKLFSFRRGEYTIDVDHHVTAGKSDWSASQYMQLVRTPPSENGDNMFIRTYTGGVIYNEEIKYEKIDFDDIADENLKRELKDGWLAMIQHYFLAAWLPQNGSNNLYYTRHSAKTGHYILGTRTPAQKLSRASRRQFHTRLVVGPKLQNKLEEIEPVLN